MIDAWSALLVRGTIESLDIYINQYDLVPTASSLLAALSGRIVRGSHFLAYEGIKGSLGNHGILTEAIRNSDQNIKVHPLSCPLPLPGSPLDCHLMYRYREGIAKMQEEKRAIERLLLQGSK